MKPRRVLLVAPEFGIDADGSYRPGGISQFSRCVARALASCPGGFSIDPPAPPSLTNTTPAFRERLLGSLALCAAPQARPTEES